MYKYLIFLLMLFALEARAQRNPQWAVPVPVQYVDNLYMVDEGIYRSAQPDAQGFAELERKGIREVLNLRQLVSDNPYKAYSSLLTFHHVKMMAEFCDRDDAVNALRFIYNRKGPIVIHCKHGSDRTGLVVALYRILFQGWSKEAAIDEMKNGGYNFHRIYFNIASFIENVDVDELKKEVMQER
ncbi:MAG: tyrosine-protein phosphatase [Bacteroidales bacterium]|jgi:protein tyrosine/serine phosphatase|nr:tyrosine-protein phosphatase [Bacteroidales bacterium]